MNAVEANCRNKKSELLITDEAFAVKVNRGSHHKLKGFILNVIVSFSTVVQPISGYSKPEYILECKKFLLGIITV